MSGPSGPQRVPTLAPTTAFACGTGRRALTSPCAPRVVRHPLRKIGRLDNGRTRRIRVRPADTNLQGRRILSDNTPSNRIDECRDARQADRRGASYFDYPRVCVMNEQCVRPRTPCLRAGERRAVAGPQSRFRRAHSAVRALRVEPRPTARDRCKPRRAQPPADDRLTSSTAHVPPCSTTTGRDPLGADAQGLARASAPRKESALRWLAIPRFMTERVRPGECCL